MGRRTGAFSALQQNAPSDMPLKAPRRSGAFSGSLEEEISVETQEKRPAANGEVYFHNVSAEDLKALLEELRGICRSAGFQASLKTLREHDGGALLKREGMAKLLGMFWKTPLKAKGFSVDAHGFPRMMAVVREHWDLPGVRSAARHVERDLGIDPGALFCRALPNGSSPAAAFLSSVYVEVVDDSKQGALNRDDPPVDDEQGHGTMSDAESEVIDCSDSNDGNATTEMEDPLNTAKEDVQCWEIVGGATKGGILVREEERINSMQYTDRLATGSVVEEIELKKDRLHYKLLEGQGPPNGWVTTRLQDGKEMARRTCLAENAKDPSSDKMRAEANRFAQGDAEHSEAVAVKANGTVDDKHSVVGNEPTSEVNGHRSSSASTSFAPSNSEEFIPLHSEDPLNCLLHPDLREASRQACRLPGGRTEIHRPSLQVSFAAHQRSAELGAGDEGLSDSSDGKATKPSVSADSSPDSRHSRLGSGDSRRISEVASALASQQPSRRHSVVSFAEEVDYITDFIDNADDGTSTENMSAFSAGRRQSTEQSTSGSSSCSFFGGWDLEVFSYGRERRTSVVSVGANSDNWEIGEVGSPVGEEDAGTECTQAMSSKRSQRRGKSVQTGILKKSSSITSKSGADHLQSSLRSLQASREAQKTVVQRLVDSKLSLLAVGTALILGAYALHSSRRRST